MSKDNIIDLTSSDVEDEDVRIVQQGCEKQPSKEAVVMKLKLAGGRQQQQQRIISISPSDSILALYKVAAETLSWEGNFTLTCGFPPKPLTDMGARIDAVLRDNEKVLITSATSTSNTTTALPQQRPSKRPRVQEESSLSLSVPHNRSIGEIKQEKLPLHGVTSLENDHAASAPTWSPFKLIQTDSDKRSTNPLVQTYCLSLRQMLGFDDKMPSSDAARTTITWICVSNFYVDFEFLLNTMPELLSIPICVVFYQHGLQEMYQQKWIQQGKNVTFVNLNPSAEPRRNGNPNSSNPLRYKFPYGCHHTKMFLAGRSDGTLRVIVHTANLLPHDNAVKAQGAFVQDFPLKTLSSPPLSSFEDDLVDYLKTYGYEEKQTWSRGHSLTLCDEIARYDFSAAKGVLIVSTPGYHQVEDRNRGYLKLSRAIQEHCPVAPSTEPIVCQFSSIGALSAKYLQAFATALNAAQTPCREDSLKLVFPTSECIRNSVEGYLGGGTVPSKQTNVSKPFLRTLWHKWASPAGYSHPLEKPTNVPHIKTYYQQTPNRRMMQWFCLASHNLSKPAWGEIRTNARGSSLYIQHWELGVFCAPSLWGGGQEGSVTTMGPPMSIAATGGRNPATPARNGDDDDDDDDGLHIAIPLPYAVDPTPNGPHDTPFSWNASYPSAPDRQGLIGTGVAW